VLRLNHVHLTIYFNKKNHVYSTNVFFLSVPFSVITVQIVLFRIAA